MSKHDDFNEIEQLLNDLPVREPSRMLDERIAATLGQEQSALATSRRCHAAKWRYAAAAAAVVIAGCVGTLLLVRGLPTTQQASPELAQPTPPPDQTPAQPDEVPQTPPVVVNANHDKPVHLVWTRDLGEQTRYTDTGRPYRAVVRQTIDQRVWVDPETGETVQITTPREELYIAKRPVY